jgi:hypothetical protein
MWRSIRENAVAAKYFFFSFRQRPSSRSTTTARRATSTRASRHWGLCCSKRRLPPSIRRWGGVVQRLLRVVFFAYGKKYSSACSKKSQSWLAHLKTTLYYGTDTTNTTPIVIFLTTFCWSFLHWQIYAMFWQYAFSNVISCWGVGKLLCLPKKDENLIAQTRNHFTNSKIDAMKMALKRFLS